ncbi:MAG: YidC/Oxa1 family membrane protein insertase [bacterium]
MGSLFHSILYQPLFNLLIWLYNIIPGHDMGIAIIVLTILIKLALYPLTQQSLKSQKALTKIQPELDAIRKAHKDDKEKQAKEMMALYAREKVNPTASCLPLLIQLPILIALYQVLIAGVAGTNFSDLYPFVANPGQINHLFLGYVNLGTPSIVFAVLAGIAQFFQTRQLTRTRPPAQVQGSPGAKDEGMTAMMNKQMLYVMPIVTVFIGIKLPAGLSLYWLVTNLAQIVQQHFVFKDARQPVTHVDAPQIQAP